MSKIYMGLGINHKDKKITYLGFGINENDLKETCEKRASGIPWKIFNLHHELVEDFYQWLLDNDFTKLEAIHIAEESIQVLLKLMKRRKNESTNPSY